MKVVHVAPVYQRSDPQNQYNVFADTGAILISIVSKDVQGAN